MNFCIVLKSFFIIIAQCLFLSNLQGQTASVQEKFSHYYQVADSLIGSGEHQLALTYFDSSRLYFVDSVEYAYSLVRTARSYDKIGKPDSALFFYEEAESWVRSISEKEPLNFFLLYRSFHFDRKKNLSASKRDLNELLQIIRDEDHRSAYLKSDVYKSLAETGLKVGKLDSVYYFITKMNEFLEKDFTRGIEPHHYNTMAWYHYRIRDLGSALKILKKNFDWYNIQLEQIEPVHVPIVGNIAITYVQLGDFERAEKYQLATLNMLERKGLNEGHRYQVQLGSLANLYLTMERYEEALNLYNRQIEIYKSINNDYKTAYYYQDILIEKAQALSGSNRFQESLLMFEEILDYFKNNPDYDDIPYDIYLYKGLSELLAKRYQSGLESLYRALAIQRSNGNASVSNAVPTYSNIASAYAGLNQFDQAITYLDSAIWINQFNAEFHQDSVGRVGILRWQVEMYNDKLEILKKAWEYQNDGSIIDLAFETIERGNLTLDYARKVLVSDESKLRIAEDFYRYAVYFCLKKYHLTNEEKYLWKALSFNENNKAFLLSSLTNQRQVSKNLDYQKLLDQREEFKQLMQSYAAQGDINKQYVFYAKLDSIQSKVDEYANYKHFREIDSTFFTKRYAGISVLSAHLGFNTIGFFLVNGSQLSLKEIRIDSSFDDSIVDFRKLLTSPESEILQLGWFDTFLEWVSPQLNNRLVIIPDGILNYLPFELITHSLNETQFLFEKTNITYRNSVGQSLGDNFKRRSSSYNMISYAPEFENQSLLATADVVRGGLAKLPGATEEAVSVKELFGGKSYTNHQATESIFKETSRDVSFIHLATHAIIDDLNPDLSRLVFSVQNDSVNDGYLHAYEIYNLDLNAQLVTLSACNTGFGKIRKGEGVMSLSRAFAYAGVPATVVSLWPASDKSTPELMKHFYQNLKDGQAKDEALNNARKQYLATAKGKARHPFYWGGFVLIGDNSPVVKNRSVWLWIIPFMLLALILSVLYLRKTKSVKALG